MAEDDSQGDKTEEPTETRREEFRKKGDVAYTKELSLVLLLIIMSGLLLMTNTMVRDQFQKLFEYHLGLTMIDKIRSGDSVLSFLGFGLTKLAIVVSPVLAVTFLIGIGSHVLQKGFIFVEDAFSLKTDRINPIEGLKRIFSLKNLFENVKGIFKIAIIIGVLYLIVRTEVNRLEGLMFASTAQIMGFVGMMAVKLLLGVGATMAVIALIDYFYQRWELEKKMMMTKQEVKAEFKSREGDPLVRSRIRKIQREMATRRMFEEIPKATVVVTNPTHIAVVLKYNDSLPAPQLVAKGADLMAEKIKNVAREHGIPIYEDKPLARTIWKTLKIGSIIPKELFVAVAQILSRVYRDRGIKRL